MAATRKEIKNTKNKQSSKNTIYAVKTLILKNFLSCLHISLFEEILTIFFWGGQKQDEFPSIVLILDWRIATLHM